MQRRATLKTLVPWHPCKTPHLSQARPRQARWHVSCPQCGNHDMDPDEDGAQEPCSHADRAKDGHLPDAVEVPRAVQRQVVVVQSGRCVIANSFVKALLPSRVSVFTEQRGGHSQCATLHVLCIAMMETDKARGFLITHTLSNRGRLLLEPSMARLLGLHVLDMTELDWPNTQARSQKICPVPCAAHPRSRVRVRP